MCEHTAGHSPIADADAVRSRYAIAGADAVRDAAATDANRGAHGTGSRGRAEPGH